MRPSLGKGRLLGLPHWFCLLVCFCFVFCLFWQFATGGRGQRSGVATSIGQKAHLRRQATCRHRCHCACSSPRLKQKILKGRSSTWCRGKVSDSKTDRQEKPHRQNCMLYHLLAVTLLSHSPSVWVEVTLSHSLGYHEVGRFSSHKAPTVPAGAQLAHGDWRLGLNPRGQF